MYEYIFKLQFAVERMELKSKGGLSPVIATTLLVLIAVIIALIIFLWVRAFIGEEIQKDLGGGYETIKNFCDGQYLQFSANVIYDDISGSGQLDIDIQNSGNVPIQGIQVKKTSLASVKDVGNASFTSVSAGPLTSGDDTTVSIPANGVNVGDNVRIIAVLLGELQNGGGKKEYACSKNYVEAEVTV